MATRAIKRNHVLVDDPNVRHKFHVACPGCGSNYMVISNGDYTYKVLIRKQLAEWEDISLTYAVMVQNSSLPLDKEETLEYIRSLPMQTEWSGSAII